MLRGIDKDGDFRGVVFIIGVVNFDDCTFCYCTPFRAQYRRHHIINPTCSSDFLEIIVFIHLPFEYDSVFVKDHLLLFSQLPSEYNLYQRNYSFTIISHYKYIPPYYLELFDFISPQAKPVWQTTFQILQLIVCCLHISISFSYNFFFHYRFSALIFFPFMKYSRVLITDCNYDEL